MIERLIKEIYNMKYPKAPIKTAMVFIFLFFIYITNNNKTKRKAIMINKNKGISKIYLNNMKPDRNIPVFTQNTKITGILNFMIPNPTITLPVGIINPKKIDKIPPINKIV